MNDQNKCPKGGYEVYVSVFEENFDKAQWQTPQGEWLGLPDQESYNYVRELCVDATCWLYTLCNLHYRSYYEYKGLDQGVSLIRACILIFVLCVLIQ